MRINFSNKLKENAEINPLHGIIFEAHVEGRLNGNIINLAAGWETVKITKQKVGKSGIVTERRSLRIQMIYAIV